MIGGTGKIGSYILTSLNAPDNNDYPQSLHAAAVPRGVCPGCLSPDDTPIFACVPSSSIVDVYDTTLPHRRKDLVFLCNCIPSRHLVFDNDFDITFAILHFGVSVDATPSVLVPTPILNNSPNAPATVMYGKHSTKLFDLLQKDGIPVRIANCAQEVQAAAAKKLAWSSLMWLTCHGLCENGRSMQVKDVHRYKSDELKRLVEDILPALETLASENWTAESKTVASSPDSTTESIGSVQDVLDYLHSYSMSISNGNVTPNKKLALIELQERNGLLLSLARSEKLEKNSFHEDLIRKVAGDDMLAQCYATDTKDDTCRSVERRKSLRRVKFSSSDLEFLYQQPNKDNTQEVSNSPKSVVIVGAGMIGSSIAYHLSKRGVNVTVLDQRTNLFPRDESTKDSVDPGTATSSSFCWLNSNDKSPLSYKQFNHLGMEVWRRHDVMKALPVWCGSMVRTAKSSPPTKSPLYLCVGPLNSEEELRLEPGVDWQSSSSVDKIQSIEAPATYFYPEEGHVDPVSAVTTLRVAARGNGVQFIEGVDINHLVYSGENDKVTGVEYTARGASDTSLEPVLATADTIVIAAGANSSNPLLGVDSDFLQLLEQPGVLAYARRSSGEGDDDKQKSLKRIFVDTISQTHLLGRGQTIVIGGGKLITGGRISENEEQSQNDSNSRSSADESIDEDAALGNAMITAAVEAIAPHELTHPLTRPSSPLLRVSRANRPMPSDGYPVLGFVGADPGLYVAVMHSGITLGLLSGELASYEIYSGAAASNEQNGFEILQHYRPSQSRFEK